MTDIDKLLDEARRLSVEARQALWSARVSACALEREANGLRSERKLITIETWTWSETAR